MCIFFKRGKYTEDWKKTLDMAIQEEFPYGVRGVGNSMSVGIIVICAGIKIGYSKIYTWCKIVEIKGIYERFLEIKILKNPILNKKWIFEVLRGWLKSIKRCLDFIGAVHKNSIIFLKKWLSTDKIFHLNNAYKLVLTNWTTSYSGS